MQLVNSIIFTFVILFSTLNINAQTEWELAKNKNDINVYTRKLPGAKLKDYRAEIVANTTIDKVVNIILDFDNYTNWFASTANCYLLEKKSETELYQYYEAKAPWPVSNRDIVTKFTIESIEDGIRLNLKGLPTYMAEKKGIVRLPKFEGFWEITNQPDGMVKIVQQASSDPGGSIPNWLANAVVVDTPFESFSNLKELLK